MMFEADETALLIDELRPPAELVGEHEAWIANFGVAKMAKRVGAGGLQLRDLRLTSAAVTS